MAIAKVYPQLTSLQHQVQFSARPDHVAFPTKPKTVSSRNICDLTEVPDGVTHIYFADLVEVAVTLDGKAPPERYYTPPFNEETYIATTDAARVSVLEGNGWSQVPVNAALVGKLWVFETARRNDAAA